MIMDKLTILSQNVKGFKDNFKRVKVLRWATAHKADLFFTQESHYEQTEFLEWTKTWKGDFFSSIGCNNSRGVTTFVREGLDYTLLRELKDDDGRYIIIYLKIHEQNIVIANFYGPNKDDNNFINELLEKN